MSLGVALQISQNSLSNVSRQTNTIARNISGADDPNYTRRYAVVESESLGSRVSVMRVQIEQNLTRSGLEAQSRTSAQSLLAQQFARLGETINGVDGERSAFAAIGALQDRLQVWSVDPSNGLLGSAVLQDAKTVVSTLHSGTREIERMRIDADLNIARDVSRLNELLQDFQAVNARVIDGQQSGLSDLDAFDERAALLSEISQIVPVTTISRENGDMALYTGGTTLFETVPRPVAFTPSATLGPGTTGGVVTVDGLQIRAGQNANSTARGSIAANLQLRDTVLPQAQSQLDEIARGLIAAFSESGTGVPDQTGLFDYPGGPGLPADGTVVAGLAGTISINASFDPAQGGNINFLRDGGANGAAYVANGTGEVGFADRLIALTGEMTASRNFDTDTGLDGQQGLVAFSSSAIGWLDGQTADAGRERDIRQAVHERLQATIADERGVDVDAEMSRLLELERAYEASARMIATVDEMLNSLFAATR
ncbi:MAG: flagellar hook-associated protein FlgK [Ahrensia sp.]|nr:flagellar hook-associated protein FlgK [Ahrensia sp.]